MAHSYLGLAFGFDLNQVVRLAGLNQFQDYLRHYFEVHFERWDFQDSDMKDLARFFLYPEVYSNFLVALAVEDLMVSPVSLYLALQADFLPVVFDLGGAGSDSLDRFDFEDWIDSEFVA